MIMKTRYIQIRLTPKNASNYIGYKILFKSRGIDIVKKILSVSATAVKIDHPDLRNHLVMTRRIYILIARSNSVDSTKKTKTKTKTKVNNPALEEIRLRNIQITPTIDFLQVLTGTYTPPKRRTPLPIKAIQQYSMIKKTPTYIPKDVFKTINDSTSIKQCKNTKKKRHKHIKQPDGLFHCSYCQYTSKKTNTLSMHIRQKHIVTGWENTFDCQLCNKQFRFRSGFHQHNLLYHTKIYKECPYCLKRFKNDSVFTHVYNKHRHSIDGLDSNVEYNALTSHYKKGKLLYSSYNLPICSKNLERIPNPKVEKAMVKKDDDKSFVEEYNAILSELDGLTYLDDLF